MVEKDFISTYYRYLRYILAKDDSTATPYDKYMALAYAVRSELVDKWIKTQKYYHENNVRRLYFLSMEYIFGKSLYQNMVNLDIEKSITSAIKTLGFSLEDVYQFDEDFELGNGGKGRAAACFLESISTLDIPASAYGLRYDYAQFQQEIKNGVQFERPLDWLHKGHPWEIIRPEYGCKVDFAGDIEAKDKATAMGPYEWKNTEQVIAVPYDVPITGYHNQTVNTLRLWSARASEEFLPDYVNHGDYVRACEEKSLYGRITKVLFPEEDVRRATELRIKQQFFFVSAALQDILRRYKMHNPDIKELDKKVVIQLMGSRCALAIPEMMRLLVDKENVPWMKAWEITRNVFSYTSHAVTRDNLETWPVYKLKEILPRHMQIIFDINQVHLDKARSDLGLNSDLIRELSIIEEGEVKRVRLADLAVLGSFSVNGVSREQTEILKKKIFPQFATYVPERFRIKTFGIAHRRWLLCANNALSELIKEAIGDSWIVDPQRLQDLEKYVDDKEFLIRLCAVKKSAKARLADYITKSVGIQLDHSPLFDIQSRNIHPGKRQVLHVLHILQRYLKIKQGESLACPRVHIFAGKASPSDFLAKQIIHLINVTADLVNKDPATEKQMKVVFIPNFGITWAERIIPAADLSEQISTAFLEASGTFNMKFAFNGAVTIASRSGSNIEMVERIGAEYIYPFGKTGDELLEFQNYRPMDVLNSDQRLKGIFALLDGLIPKVQDGNAINPLLSSLRDADRQYVLLDYNDYIMKQELIDKLYIDQEAWAKTSLMNIARIGWFSSDRVVSEYVNEVWKV
jgi:glycogen phosphorylase